MSPLVWPWLWPAWSIMSPNVSMNVNADHWDYGPITEWGQGDVRVEQRVNREVASYGRQIGILCDAVLDLARHCDALDEPSVQRLARLTARVEQIKGEVKAMPPPPAI